MKLKTLLLTGLAVVTFGVIGANHVDAASYTINDEFNLGANEGSSQRAVPNAVVLHETANETATGRNEATFMKRNWMNAYTTDIVGDGGIVYRIGQQGYVSYGAGNFNGYAPVQIELQHTHDRALFEKNYRAYVEYARDSAKRFNIPLTLDQGTTVNDRGIKSHLWISNYIWGDHSDPYGYLAEMGVSKAKLAYDLANGFSGSSNVTPEQPKPSEPSKPGQTVQVKAWNKTNKADTTVNIRAAQTTNSQVIGQLKAGQTFNATRVTTQGQSVNGYTTWFEVNGRGWVSGALVTEVKNAPAPSQSFTAENGRFVAGGTINIRSGASLSASIVGQYVAGQSFTYNGYVVNDGYVWARYTAYSGATRYVAVRNAVTRVALGTFY